MGFCLQEIQLYLPNCRITSIFLFRYIIQKDVICIMILYLIRRYRVIISIIIFSKCLDWVLLLGKVIPKLERVGRCHHKEVKYLTGIFVHSRLFCTRCIRCICFIIEMFENTFQINKVNELPNHIIMTVFKKHERSSTYCYLCTFYVSRQYVGIGNWST